MNEAFVVRDLYPVLPELVLAVGAMVLLMLGAFQERAVTAINWLAILLLIAAGAVICWLPAERLEAFGGSQQAVGQWQCCGSGGTHYYTAPQRIWSYDTLFNTNPPPGTPQGVLILRGAWSQQ